MTVLLFLFQFEFFLLVFLVWFLWLRLSTLWSIKEARVSILVLFLILEEMLSGFDQWVLCWLWFSRIQPLICWDMFPLWGFPWLSFKGSACSAEEAGDTGSIPASGTFPRGGNGKPLQYSCLKNPMGRGAWSATVLGFTNRHD